jgi:hypothetical protein
MRHIFLAVTLLCVTRLSAQSADELYVLVPIALSHPIAGAFGSGWESELWVHNGGPVAAGNARGCQITYEGQQCLLPFAPGTTSRAPSVQLESAFNAVLMYVGPPGALAHMQFSSRLFETSRHAQPLGVEVPVVREADFFIDPVRFVGVSGSSSTRVALRVYHADRLENRSGGAVRVDLYRPDSSIIASKVLTLAYGPADWDPGYAAILDLRSSIPELEGIERYDVTVTPLKSDMHFYALVSTTDVNTQQVLVITPQRSH